MKRERPTLATGCKYVALQLPALALLVLVLLLLDHWLELPRALFWGIILAWIAKDALLFPLVWKSYQPAPAAGHHNLIGQSAVAVEDLAPGGYARIAGELWACRLESAGHVVAGSKVTVTGISGLTLLVRPTGQPPSP